MKIDSAWQGFANPLGFVRLILLVDWDPLRIFGEAGAMDEYDRYAVQIHDLLCSGATQEELRGNKEVPLPEVAAKLQRTYDKTASDSRTV